MSSEVGVFAIQEPIIDETQVTLALVAEHDAKVGDNLESHTSQETDNEKPEEVWTALANKLFQSTVILLDGKGALCVADTSPSDNSDKGSRLRGRQEKAKAAEEQIQ